MRRFNVLYKISHGDQDHQTNYFPLINKRNIKNHKYWFVNLLTRLFSWIEKPTVNFIPVGFFLILIIP